MNAAVRSSILFKASPVVAPTVEAAIQERTRTRRAQAWLALHFYQWPLYTLLIHKSAAERSALQTTPIAVLAKDQQRHVLACNAFARNKGIRPGHSLNTAIALCSDTHFLTRDEMLEARMLAAMAAWMQRYTPYVSIEAPNELLLEVRGSLRLFGGIQAFIAKVQAELQQQDIAAGISLSATSRSALWFARSIADPACFGPTQFDSAQHRQPKRYKHRDKNKHTAAIIVPPRTLKTQLASLPIQCLHWPDEVALRLMRFGVKTLGDLLRLPRADLGRRISSACMLELEHALGRRFEIRTPFKLIESYCDRVILDFEIEMTGLLQPIIERRMTVLQDFLRERNSAIGDLNIYLKHRENATTRLRIGLASCTSDMQHVIKLINEQLDKTALHAPVIEIKLQAKRLLAAQPISADLFHKHSDHDVHLSQAEKLNRLLEQLSARLGENAIRALHPCADHRPEKAQQFIRANVAATQNSFELPASLPQRPLWLLHPPRRLAKGNRLPKQFTVLQGPERIETGWWDDAPTLRDYFIANDNHGARCWVYFDHLSSCWYLHGLFG